MKAFASDNPPQVSMTQLAASPQPSLPVNRHAPMPVEYFLLGLLMSLLVGVLSYKQYRAWLFWRRVETLERLWKLSIPRKAL